MASRNNGHGGGFWTRLAVINEAEVGEGGLSSCKPQMRIDSERIIFIALPNSVYIYGLPTEKKSYQTYWSDGMLGHNSGALLLDKDGGLYTGTLGLGVAYSNISYPLAFNG